MAFYKPSHDDFIRGILANKSIAIDFTKSALPDRVIKLLDFDSFEQVPDTYLSEELKKTISDIVYRCKLKSGEESVYITLLIEHKSFPYKYAPVQIGSYMFSGFQKQIDNNEPLSPVLPILLYHGEKEWKYRKLEDLFGHLDEELKKYLPSFEFVFHDLGRLNDDQIEALHNRFLAASLMALKYSQNSKWILENMVKLLLLVNEGGATIRKQFLIYISSRGKLDEKILNSLPQPIKTEVMNTLEIYYKKGEEKGLEKGKIKEVENLIIKLGLSDQQICDVAEVTPDFVKKIRASLEERR